LFSKGSPKGLPFTFNDPTVYPNPASGKLNVSFNPGGNEKYILKAVDFPGNPLSSKIISAQEGNNLDEIDLSKVSKGMCF
jgi:type IX secretion system substrate protein